MPKLIQNIYEPAKLLAAFGEDKRSDATFCEPIPSAPRSKNQNQ